MPPGPYMVAFSYGSVVFFGASPAQREQYLAICRQVATLPAELPHNEGAL